MKIKRFLTVIAACALLLPAAAAAQPKMTSGLDESGEPFSNQYYVTLPDRIGLTLLRDEKLGPGAFIMRMSMFDARSGCARLSPLSVSPVTYDNMYADVRVASYRVDNRDAPKNPQECDMRAQIPVADIPMNKDDLKARGISKIRFHYMSYTDTYTIEIGDDRIKLEPTKVNARNVAGVYTGQKAYKVATPLELWFLPSDTVVLYAPGVPMDRDVAMQMEIMARGRGLVPLAETMPSFVAAASTPPHFYFTDPGDKYASKLADDRPQPFDKLQLKKVIYGLHGDEVVREPFDVYMKKPGIYE